VKEGQQVVKEGRQVVKEGRQVVQKGQQVVKEGPASGFILTLFVNDCQSYRRPSLRGTKQSRSRALWIASYLAMTIADGLFRLCLLRRITFLMLNTFETITDVACGVSAVFLT
jgi:hypothetical protein